MLFNESDASVARTYFNAFRDVVVKAKQRKRHHVRYESFVLSAAEHMVPRSSATIKTRARLKGGEIGCGTHLLRHAGVYSQNLHCVLISKTRISDSIRRTT